MRGERVRSILERQQAGGVVTATGWLRTVRHAKEVSFLDLTDGSCLSGIQVVANPDLDNYESEIKQLRTGCAVLVTGELIESPGKGQRYEIQARAIDLIGDVGDDYPLQKKRHSFEFLRTIAHLRPRTNSIGAVLRIRNAASYAVHRFFQDRNFIHLHSPIITLSDAEGAGEMFRVTTLDPHNPGPGPEGADWRSDFFGDEAFLTVSGQMEAEIAALALSDVYTFGPTFRAENSNTSRHLAEFWMIEPEMAFCDLSRTVDLAEQFIRFVLTEVLENCDEDISFFNTRIDDSLVRTLRTIVDTPFVQLSYSEAILALDRSNAKFEYPVKWGIDLQGEHERYLSEVYVKGPVVVTDYPRDIKAFYMYVNDDNRTVRAMDVLVPRIGEIVGGSQREHRHHVLVERLKEQGLSTEKYSWYLDLRRHGSAPHAGFGVGFERLIQLLTGMANIRDVIPFPRVPGYAAF